MIVVTGAAGFIGSCLVSRLNAEGFNQIVVVDKFLNDLKAHNLVGKEYVEKVDRDIFKDWLKEHGKDVQFIFHIGARTDTTEFNKAIFDELNLNYSKDVWNLATLHRIPLVYASSAATYGLGEYGYIDSHDVVENLKPLNPYGESKNDFDKWVLKQTATPPFWAGLKFFNVFGPNEYHKGRMASVIFHAYRQILHTDKMKLFRSHNPAYSDGGQTRDFIYVKDLLNICIFLYKNQPESGLYNVGTGNARTFNDLVIAVFKALNKKIDIEYIDTPIDIRDKYQYFTEASTDKLLAAGYQDGFCTLEQGVTEYVKEFLMDGKFY
ncbi:MAG: ADP-glyceromanno-heptose 6-epimerase [Brumimicrobium sp.]|nr:ADP-glyceromanno-heptose 6-epimerase [Brumimicrobium sp.]